MRIVFLFVAAFLCGDWASAQTGRLLPFAGHGLMVTLVGERTDGQLFRHEFSIDSLPSSGRPVLATLVDRASEIVEVQIADPNTICVLAAVSTSERILSVIDSKTGAVVGQFYGREIVWESDRNVYAWQESSEPRRAIYFPVTRRLFREPTAEDIHHAFVEGPTTARQDVLSLLVLFPELLTKPNTRADLLMEMRRALSEDVRLDKRPNSVETVQRLIPVRDYFSQLISTVRELHAPESIQLFAQADDLSAIGALQSFGAATIPAITSVLVGGMKPPAVQEFFRSERLQLVLTFVRERYGLQAVDRSAATSVALFCLQHPANARELMLAIDLAEALNSEATFDAIIRTLATDKSQIQLRGIYGSDELTQVQQKAAAYFARRVRMP